MVVKQGADSSPNAKKRPPARVRTNAKVNAKNADLPNSKTGSADWIARIVAVIGLCATVYQCDLQKREGLANERAALLAKQLDFQTDTLRWMDKFEKDVPKEMFLALSGDESSGERLLESIKHQSELMILYDGKELIGIFMLYLKEVAKDNFICIWHNRPNNITQEQIIKANISPKNGGLFGTETEKLYPDLEREAVERQLAKGDRSQVNEACKHPGSASRSMYVFEVRKRLGLEKLDRRGRIERAAERGQPPDETTQPFWQPDSEEDAAFPKTYQKSELKEIEEEMRAMNKQYLM